MAGWKLGPVDGVDLPKCIVCVAPHTSNWDFIVGKLFYTSIGCNAGFLIKKEWFFFPFNLLFIALKANVPIVVAYFDYGKKEVGTKGVFYPTGDVDKDIHTIREMYRGVTACHPENFVQV